MGPIAIDLALMRDVLLPGLTLTPGRAVAARVVAAQNGRGSLSIAGYLVDAELPPEVHAGDALRLEVRDVDARRVLLAITTPEPATTPPPSATAVALPGGAVLSVLEDDEDPAGGGASGSGDSHGHRLSLTLQIGRLGTVDLRFALDPSALRLQASLAPGEPLTRAREQTDSLRDALAQAAGRPASVTVSPRREPLDVYA